MNTTEIYEQCVTADLNPGEVVYTKQSLGFRQAQVIYGPNAHESFVVEDAAGRWELYHCTNLWRKREVVKRKGWVNVYHGFHPNSKYVISNIYPSKEAADKGADKGRLDCIEIEWRESV